MAKDGTARGGARPGAGRKARSRDVKTLEGRLPPQPPDDDIDAPGVLEGEDMPPVEEYMKASQRNGLELRAEEVYRQTFRWLDEMGCRAYVAPQLVKQYAMAVARWIQVENAISEYGFLAKHPTTGNAIASPYVTMEDRYLKQANQCWYMIAAVVKEHSGDAAGTQRFQSDLMESLLTK